MQHHRSHLPGALPLTLFRRNGALKSCELCRKAKIRCDHRAPTCGNCEVRSVVCIYHPAPLTRRRRSTVAPVETVDNGNGLFGILDFSASSTEIRSSLCTINNDKDIHENDSMSLNPTDLYPWDPNMGESQPSGSSDACQSSASIDNRSDLTYYGWTSCTSVFAALPGKDLGLSGASSNRQLAPCSHPRVMEFGCWVVTQLEHATTICTLAGMFVQKSQLSPVATFVTVETIWTLEVLHRSLALSGTDQQTAVQSIITNTHQAVDIFPSLLARDFVSSFGGNKLRWEFLGLVFSWAGQMAITSLLYANSITLPTGFTANSFSQRMLQCSNACIELVRQMGVTSDLLTWCLYENLIFLTFEHGESSHTVWQRLGDLSDEIFALGLHREPKQPNNLPPFLVQARRKLFHASYIIDKKIAVFFGRPPRIPARYCNTPLPLDIADNLFLNDAPVINFANIPDTWDAAGSTCAATWIRARSVMGRMAEKVLEVLLDPTAITAPEEVEDLLTQSQVAWESIPSFLRYDEKSWDSTVPGMTHTALSLVILLEHLQNEFQLRRFRCHDQFDLEARDLLLDVSMRILTTSMAFVYAPTKTVEVQKDQTWILLHHAAPSAGVLANELCLRGQRGEPISSRTSRSQIIRQISALISTLEAALPSDGNLHLCYSAARTLSQTLSDTLDTPNPSTINGWSHMSPSLMLAPTALDQCLLDSWSDISY